MKTTLFYRRFCLKKERAQRVLNPLRPLIFFEKGMRFLSERAPRTATNSPRRPAGTRAAAFYRLLFAVVFAVEPAKSSPKTQVRTRLRIKLRLVKNVGFPKFGEVLKPHKKPERLHFERQKQVDGRVNGHRRIVLQVKLIGERLPAVGLKCLICPEIGSGSELHPPFENFGVKIKAVSAHPFGLVEEATAVRFLKDKLVVEPQPTPLKVLIYNDLQHVERLACLGWQPWICPINEVVDEVSFDRTRESEPPIFEGAAERGFKNFQEVVLPDGQLIDENPLTQKGRLPTLLQQLAAKDPGLSEIQKKVAADAVLADVFEQAEVG